MFYTLETLCPNTAVPASPSAMRGNCVIVLATLHSASLHHAKLFTPDLMSLPHTIETSHLPPPRQNPISQSLLCTPQPSPPQPTPPHPPHPPTPVTAQQPQHLSNSNPSQYVSAGVSPTSSDPNALALSVPSTLSLPIPVVHSRGCVPSALSRSTLHSD
jgi:hypothetical protein